MRPPSRLPSLTVLFHSDLRRVGDRTSRHLFKEGPITIGRRTPLFGDEPLNDPCISRAQLEIHWDGSYFKVKTKSAARREVRVFDIDGHNLNPDRIPPRCLLAIGKRVVLWLDCTARSRSDLGLIGHSARMHDLRKHIRKAAKVGQSVLIHGEKGSGKSHVAAAIHSVSRFADGALVTVNCAAMPPPLAESQLVAHVERAVGGCLFLDGITDLSTDVQNKLLVAIEERGTDFLLVASTHRNLQAEVKAERFVEELYTRIERPAVTVAPLRDRPEDSPLLFAHFLSIHADTLPHLIREATVYDAPVALEYVLGLMVRDWPRNVTQLRKEVTGVAMTNSDPGPFTVPDESALMSVPPPEQSDEVVVDRAALLNTLKANDFVQRRAAASLGISRTTLGKWMQQLGIRRPSDVTDDEIQGALDACGGDVERAANLLQISRRGLALRIAAPRSAE